MEDVLSRRPGAVLESAGARSMARSRLSQLGKHKSKPYRLYVLCAPAFLAGGSQQDGRAKRHKLSWAPPEEVEEASPPEELPESAEEPNFQSYPPTVSEWPANRLLRLVLRLSLTCSLIQQQVCGLSHTPGCRNLVLSTLVPSSEVSSITQSASEQASAQPSNWFNA